MLGLGLSINDAGFPLSGAAFTDPSSLPGVLAWWQYKQGYRDVSGNLLDIVSNPPINNTILGGWDDQIASMHATQTTNNDHPKFFATDSAINFLNNVKFFHLPTTTVAGDYTFCASVSLDATSDETFLGGDTGDVLKIFSSTKVVVNYSTDNSIDNASGALSTGVYYTFIFKRESGVTTLYVDGVQWGNTVTDSSDFTITAMGAKDPESANFKGKWKDASLIERALTASEISDMNTYLTNL